MPRRPCINCGTPTDGTRCANCRRARDRGRNAKRTHYHGDWARRSQQARQAWVQANGWVCPGHGRGAHPATDLELDHTTGRVLCHACNCAAGPAGAHAAIPHPPPHGAGGGG